MDATFNGVTASSVGAILLDVSPPVRAARRITTVQVPGRDGVLHIDDGSYAPIQKTVRVGTRGATNISSINAWMVQSGLFLSDYEPGVSYQAVQASAVTWERLSRRLLQATVTLECDPYRYLYPAASDIELTATGDLDNPGTAPSAPLIDVDGTGDITLLIGNQTVLLSGIESGILIDSHAKIAYKGTENIDRKMSGEFPVLLPGKTDIAWVGTVNKITITPRWRFL